MRGHNIRPGASSPKQPQSTAADPSRQGAPSSSARNRPPTGRINQKYKQRGWKEQKQRAEQVAPSRPVRQGEPGYELTKKGRQQQLFQRLLEQYGSYFADTDVRLYLKKRQLNAAKDKPSRRGRFPLDDSFDKPGTFRKLSPRFQRTILEERSTALAAALPRLAPERAWHLYTAVSSLLTLQTLEVAHKIRVMARATGLSPGQVVDLLCAFTPLAFLHPRSAEGRLGLLAKVARLNRQQAVMLLSQHPQLWLMNSQLLRPRCEELAVMLSCCTVTALKLLACCPQLLTAQHNHMQQQLSHLCSVMGCSGRPAEVVPLLLWQPKLLLMPHEAHQQQTTSSSSSRVTGGSGLLAAGPQQQQQQQMFVQEHAVGVDSVEQVNQQLQRLQQQLQLPQALVQVMVLRTPRVLELCSSINNGGSSSSASSSSVVGDKNSEEGFTDRGRGQVTALQPAAAAAAHLFSSWLCASEAALQRSKCQERLLQLMTVKAAKDRKRQQQRAGPSSQQQQHEVQWLPVGVCRYMAADAQSYHTASCQWWVRRDLLQQQLQLPLLQQVLLQAPDLLLLAAAAADQAAGKSPTAVSAAPQVIRDAGGIYAATDTLEARLHSLCQELDRVLHASEQQQQPPMQSIKQGGVLQNDRASNKQASADDLLQQVQAAAVLEPNLIAQPPSLVASQVAQLSRVMLLTPKQLLTAAQHCPAVLWLTGRQVFERVRVLCGIMRLPAPQVRQKLLDPIVLPVLLLGADDLRGSFRAVIEVGAACEGSEERARQFVRDRPELLLPGKLQLVSKLLRSKD